MVDTKRTFKSITPGFVKWTEEGQSVEGELQKIDEIAMANGTVKKYELLDDNGELKSFLGGKILDSALSVLSLGDYIKITFLGEDKTSAGQKLNLFNVELADTI